MNTRSKRITLHGLHLMTDLEIYEAFQKLYRKAKEEGNKKVFDMQEDLQGFLDTKTDWPIALKEHLRDAVHGYWNGDCMGRSTGLDRAWDSVYFMIGKDKAEEKEAWGPEGFPKDFYTNPKYKEYRFEEEKEEVA